VRRATPPWWEGMVVVGSGPTLLRECGREPESRNGLLWTFWEGVLAGAWKRYSNGDEGE